MSFASGCAVLARSFFGCLRLLLLVSRVVLRDLSLLVSSFRFRFSLIDVCCHGVIRCLFIVEF